jgi:hypothetical protein
MIMDTKLCRGKDNIRQLWKRKNDRTGMRIILRDCSRKGHITVVEQNKDADPSKETEDVHLVKAREYFEVGLSKGDREWWLMKANELLRSERWVEELDMEIG